MSFYTIPIYAKTTWYRGPSMLFGSANILYQVTSIRCLTMHKAAKICQILKTKSPHLRGLQGIFC